MYIPDDASYSENIRISIKKFLTSNGLKHKIEITQTKLSLKQKAINNQYIFKIAGWTAMNSSKVNNPFTSLCYSNCEVLINQWYAWLWKHLEEILPRKTDHKATLPPWITPQLRSFFKRSEILLGKPKITFENTSCLKNYKIRTKSLLLIKISS